MSIGAYTNTYTSIGTTLTGISRPAGVSNFRKISLYFLNSSNSVCKQIVLNFHPTNDFQLVCLANYTGCDHYLEMVASRLGAVVLMISNPKPIGNVRGLIHSRYRAHSKFLESTWTTWCQVWVDSH